uniref:Uncharacterized protein n=1 Tax=Arundo donax TaxID=35708 RepID=A0A0A8Z5C9_ARUDO
MAAAAPMAASSSSVAEVVAGSRPRLQLRRWSLLCRRRCCSSSHRCRGRCSRGAGRQERPPRAQPQAEVARPPLLQVSSSQPQYVWRFVIF